MIREIQAKTLLSSCRAPDAWFGIRYTMNTYRGCEHRCIYCDSRSECYGIEDFDHEVLVKVNAIERLEDELSRKRTVGVVGTGSMSDPYTPAEASYGLTRRALQVLARRRFPVHIITKSDMVLRDLDLLVEVNRVWAGVSFTVTTPDDALAAKLEPGAPPPSRRFAAMRQLAERGIHVGVTMMPLLPFIEDTEENVRAIVTRAAESGAHYVLPGFGMTLRNRQRTHYYAELDRLFPGLRARYERAFGERYGAHSPCAPWLEAVFSDLCAVHGLSTRADPVLPGARQLALF